MKPMSAIPFRPLGSRYLVLPDEIAAKSEHIGEYTISEVKDTHQKPSEGTVVARGKDCAELQLGSKVLYGMYSGYEQEFDGINYLVLAESEILGERIVTPFDEPVKSRTTAQIVENYFQTLNPRDFE